MTNILAQFGQCVRERRLELGLTQQEVADRAKLNRAYISDVENGRRNVSLKTIKRIAEALEASISSLLD
jgi:transcriptional regulator with XRE-family HTH domain